MLAAAELCALRSSAVELPLARMTIASSAYRDGRNVIVKDTKNHSQRRITLDPETVRVLTDHRLAMVERAEACGSLMTPDAFVFSHDPQSQVPWSPDYPSRAWTRLRRDLGLSGVRLHDFRHFQATMLLQNGIPVMDVSQRIGHRDAATTLNVYAHSLPATDQRAAAVIGSLLTSPGRSELKPD